MFEREGEENAEAAEGAEFRRGGEESEREDREEELNAEERGEEGTEGQWDGGVEISAAGGVWEIEREAGPCLAWRTTREDVHSTLLEGRPAWIFKISYRVSVPRMSRLMMPHAKR